MQELCDEKNVISPSTLYLQLSITHTICIVSQCDTLTHNSRSRITNNGKWLDVVLRLACADTFTHHLNKIHEEATYIVK